MTAHSHVPRGFVLPLALFLLTVIALLAALLVQSSVQDVHIARGELAVARAAAASGSALADALASAPDSAVLARPRGVLVTSLLVTGSDSTHVAVQSLGGGLVRIASGTRIWSGGIRADAVSVGFARIGPDLSGPPGSLSYRRLPGWWWAQIP